MGAIDFGIIIDGAVVMVEGIFVVLDKKAREVGMPAFNVMSKMGSPCDKHSRHQTRRMISH